MKRVQVILIGGDELSDDQREWLAAELQDQADLIMLENEFMAEEDLAEEGKITESNEIDIYSAMAKHLGDGRILH